MRHRLCTVLDYIDFLMSHSLHYTCVEAAKTDPRPGKKPAHDAYNRLLNDLEPDSLTLWLEARSQINLCGGLLILDDSVQDKPYASKIELVDWFYSGKHGRPVKGINLLTLLWTDGDRRIPIDYRIVDKRQGIDKLTLAMDMLKVAKDRGVQPEAVCFDSWYAATKNLKAIRNELGWHWFTRLKVNRKVRVDRQAAQQLKTVLLDDTGRQLWLVNVGLIRCWRIVASDGDTQHWASSRLDLSEEDRQRWADACWQIEQYHRDLKQHTAVERCQARSARAQSNHIGWAIRAFLRWESWCWHLGLSLYEAAQARLRQATRAMRRHPIQLIETAEAARRFGPNIGL